MYKNVMENALGSRARETFDTIIGSFISCTNEKFAWGAQILL